MMEIFHDLGSQPMVMIRFNPDSYVELSGRQVPGCFKVTKTTGFKVDKIEWKRRMKKIVGIVKHHVDNVPTKEVLTMYLFYDEK
jgi:hypothetical protein